MNNEEKEKKKSSSKLTKNRLSVIILVGLLVLITGSIMLLQRNFSIIGQMDVGGDATGSYFSGSYAYIVNDFYGLDIVDISNPIAPVKMGNYNYDRMGQGVYVSGSYAYLTDWDYGFIIIDISDPTAPVKVGEFNNGGVFGIYISGSYAYVTRGSGGLEIIDISDPTAPVKVGEFDCGGGVYVSGSYAYVVGEEDGLYIIDISDPTTPTEVGQFNDGELGFTICVSGMYAYVTYRYSYAHFDFGLRIIDISDPTSPMEVGQFKDEERVTDVYVSGSYAYLACASDGLVIIDISDPVAPEKVKQIDYGGFASNVFVSGSYAYVVVFRSGLKVIDIWSQKENISNYILWSIIGILILLVIVDLRYIIKEIKPLEEEIRHKGDEKEKILDFFKGFLITDGVIIILTISTSMFIRSSWDFEYFIFFSILMLLGIIISVIGVNTRNKNPYISMGMIAAIFGAAFLIIKKYRKHPVDPYTEQPNKKKSQLSIGFWFSIGLVILSGPLILFGIISFYEGPILYFIVIFILLPNIYIGVLIFFFKENQRYISIGMIYSLPLNMFLIYLISLIMLMN